MAKAITQITDTWTQLASGAAVFTVLSASSEDILWNDSASDTNALPLSLKKGEQVQETATRDTYVKSLGKGGRIHTDGVI